jgi:hypothetical protein
MSLHQDEPTFDPIDGVYKLHVEWDTIEGVGILVVEAVAAVMGRDPLDLEPLQDVVDVDSIQSILSAPSTRDVSIEFEYAGSIITLARSGQVRIDPL